MYNTIFGRNPAAHALLAMLGLDERTVGRFRDAYVTEMNGEPIIAIYTRNGGGNRDCHCEYETKYGTPRCKGHVIDEEVDEVVTLTAEEIEEKGYEPLNVFIGARRQAKTGRKVMRTFHVCEEPASPSCWCVGCFMTYHVSGLPGYLSDRDDEFDSTYATIHFRPPATWRELLTGMVREGAPDADWTDFLAALSDPPDKPSTRPQELAVQLIEQLGGRS